MDIVGYTNELRVTPGSPLRFYVSCHSPAYNVDIVRFQHGDPHPEGPGVKYTKLAGLGEYAGKYQPVNNGSYLKIVGSAPINTLESFTIGSWFYPSRLKGDKQTLVSKSSANGEGWSLFVNKNNNPVLSVAGVTLTGEIKLREKSWYFIAAGYDNSAGLLKLWVTPQDQWPGLPGACVNEMVADGEIVAATDADLRVAAGTDKQGKPALHFDGKVESPWLFNRLLSDSECRRLSDMENPLSLGGCIGYWDFSVNNYQMQVVDSGASGCSGELINLPTRAMKGHSWSGQSSRFSDSPAEYNAIFFHREDTGDLGWEKSFTFDVPGDFASGVYAARLNTEKGEDFVPFFVVPEKGKPTARVALLLPTLTYLAYSNEQMATRPEIQEMLSGFGGDGEGIQYPKTQEDVYLSENRLLSLYDKRRDGIGVCYSSKRRPLLSMRPSYYMPLLGPSGSGAAHLLCADLYIVDWLHNKGFEFDILTDEDLHEHGSDLLKPYDAVLTGVHPEYYTLQMLEGWREYLNAGGHGMYLGGNGFYWVTSIDPVDGHYIEVRRGLGTAPWRSDAAEEYHSTTGEQGGLWRFRGHTPQSLMGVGMTTAGADAARPYKRTEASLDGRWEDIFAGVGDDEVIGDLPNLILGYGAAGFEFDRADEALGTPPSATVLATARVDSGDSYQEVVEELEANSPMGGGTTNEKIRADMVYVEYPNGGAVWSIGSVIWCGCLSHNNYDNNVSRVTENVLRRFL